jgi:hypothetical protein
MHVRTLWLFGSVGAVLTAAILTPIIWNGDAKRHEAPHVQKIAPIAGNVESKRPKARTVHTDSIRQDSNAQGRGAGTDTAKESTKGQDYSYVGVPFPVSASIEPGRRRLNLGSCTTVFNRLATMKEAPRDLAWAPRMEQKIQDEIVSEGDGEFGVRNVECRRTICALEVTSRLISPWGACLSPPIEFLNPNKLFSNVCGYSPTETDVSRVKTTVTLVV